MARLQEFETPKRRGRPPLARIEDAPPKRRGRPPKVLAETVEPPKRRGRPPLIRTAIEEPPKRRGRPPLVRTGLRAEEPPKRRGRPPRASAAMEAEPPKRRARPPRLSVREIAEIAAGDQPKRRGRPARARPEADEGVKKAFPLIGRNDLNRLLEEAAIFHNRASSATGALGELIKDYVQKKHLHAGAFKIINRWKKMADDDPQKLWLELAHVDDMRQKAGLDRIAKAQGQLLPAIADEAPAKPEPPDEREEDENQMARSHEAEVDYPPPRAVEERAGDAAA